MPILILFLMLEAEISMNTKPQAVELKCSQNVCQEVK